MKKLIPIFILFLAIPIFLFNFWNIIPIKYKDLIVYYSEEFDLSEELVCAVIYTESGFDETAVSSAGAMGLMQVMPSTAIEISNRLNCDKFDLLNPKDNIRFGCFYLRYLLDYYDEDIVLALCGYNAGFNKVDDWDFMGDIEKIPYAETKSYVKKVMKYMKVYGTVYF